MYSNDAQKRVGESDKTAVYRKSRWTDVPFTQLNVIGWHFPQCLVEKMVVQEDPPYFLLYL